MVSVGGSQPASPEPAVKGMAENTLSIQREMRTPKAQWVNA